MWCRPFARVFAVLLAAGSCTPPAGPVAGGPEHRKPDLLNPLPEFTLTERSGKTVTKNDLVGHVWVASFVFTRCTGPCPQVSAAVARLHHELLKDRPDVRFVTFTVDPDRDTPDELKKYAERYRADPERWLFLTGPEAAIHKLAKDAFLLLVERRPDAKPGDEFDHSTALMLIDKRGTVRFKFDGARGKSDADGQQFEANLRQLAAAAAGLAQE